MRASDLTVNMTRDMNASFQRGWMSMGTQFWSFQTRTMEQMIFGGAAGTLTKADRAKIFAYNSAMFGLPVGAASVTGWEWKETARQMLMEHGVEADDNLVEVARDGLLSTAISMMTGTDFDTSNIAPGGLPQFKEIMKMWNGDARDQQSLFELLGGAGATTGAQLAVGVKEGYTTAANLIRYFNGDKDYEPTVEDLMEPLEAVSSLSAARRVIRATRLGEYITGYEEATGLPISGKEALVEMLTGFTKDDRIDYYATKEFLEAQRMETREMKEEAQRLVRLSDQARDAGDPEQAKKYFRRAKTAAYNAGLTGADWLDVFDYVEEANKPSRRTEKSFQQWVAQDRIEEIQRQQEEGAR